MVQAVGFEEGIVGSEWMIILSKTKGDSLVTMKELQLSAFALGIEAEYEGYLGGGNCTPI